MKHAKAIHHHESPSHIDPQTNRWVNKVEDREVIVLATSGVWAMVRRPRCSPYACRVKELTYR